MNFVHEEMKGSNPLVKPWDNGWWAEAWMIKNPVNNYPFLYDYESATHLFERLVSEYPSFAFEDIYHVVTGENGCYHYYEDIHRVIETKQFDSWKDLYNAIGNPHQIKKPKFNFDPKSHYGWIDRDGHFYGCQPTDHARVAMDYFGVHESELEKKGWVKLTKGDFDQIDKIFCDFDMNDYQLRTLHRIGWDENATKQDFLDGHLAKAEGTKKFIYEAKKEMTKTLDRSK